MAPRKKTEKEEKATGASGADMILHYLRRSLYFTSCNLVKTDILKARRTDRTLPLRFLPTYTTRSQRVSYASRGQCGEMADKVKAAAAKLLKDLHEQKQIEGRPAGEYAKVAS